jgi:hypothetical protein
MLCSLLPSIGRASNRYIYSQPFFMCNYNIQFIDASLGHCSHSYCKSCLERWKQTETICPKDNKELGLFFPNYAAANVVNKLRVRCRNRTQGCQWEGKHPFPDKIHNRRCKRYLRYTSSTLRLPNDRMPLRMQNPQHPQTRRRTSRIQMSSQTTLV